MCQHWRYCSFALSHRYISSALHPAIFKAKSSRTRKFRYIVKQRSLQHYAWLNGRRTCMFIAWTHNHLVRHTCVRESGQHWFRLVAYSTPSHYLKQCFVIVTYCSEILIKKTKLSIQDNGSEYIVCETVATLCWGGGGGGGGVVGWGGGVVWC